MYNFHYCYMKQKFPIQRTLATDIDVIPMVIYTEFTLSANIAMASALSIVLGIITWILLLIARSLSGSTVAGGG